MGIVESEKNIFVKILGNKFVLQKRKLQESIGPTSYKKFILSQRRYNILFKNKGKIVKL